MGRVVWITGLSGSGKTTLAKALQRELPYSILLDGDELREALGRSNRGFDVENRKNLARTYARLAGLLARQGFIVLVATISLFHELHAWNKQNLPGYLEIFLDVPEEIRRRRDPKGLYAANVPNMVGETTKPEFPLEPRLTLNADLSLEEAAGAVMKLINEDLGR